jgi:hypothetical protein
MDSDCKLDYHSASLKGQVEETKSSVLDSGLPCSQSQRGARHGPGDDQPDRRPMMLDNGLLGQLHGIACIAD